MKREPLIGWPTEAGWIFLLGLIAATVLAYYRGAP